MLGLVCLVFGLIVCVMEFLHWAVFRMHASFLFSFFGRGLFYFMCGCLTIDSNAAQLGIGIVLVVFGVIYMCLTFVTSLYFDDPDDEYAMVIYNMQHGFYEGKLGHDGLGKKSGHSMGMFSGQGISSETYTPSGSLALQSAGFSSADVPKRSTSNSGTRYPTQPATAYHMQSSV
ncbi:hypothetical protein EC988_001782 [Linderina pennispora]|nr:hypothetical protein EC988_001782 [Linderina pennispora]